MVMKEEYGAKSSEGEIFGLPGMNNEEIEIKEEFIEENNLRLYLSDDDVDEDDEKLGNLATTGNETTFNSDVKRTRSTAAAEKQNYAASVKDNCDANVCRKEPENKTPGHRKNVKDSSKVCTFDGCWKVFSSPSRLRCHMNRHTGERPWKCSVQGCNRAYMRHQALKRHLEMNHMYKEIIKIKCEDCGNLFSNKDSLKKHYVRFHVLRMFTCVECKKSFKKQQHLQTHSFVHTGIKPFGCDYPGCKMRCMTPSRLKRHKIIHKKNRYTCCWGLCSATFDHMNGLRRHVKVKHSKQKECDVCGEIFSEPCNLRRHLLFHRRFESKGRRNYHRHRSSIPSRFSPRFPPKH